MSTEDVSFFGAPDRNPVNGKVGSSYPCWMMDRQVEQLEEEVRRRKSWIDRGLIAREDQPSYLAQTREHEERLQSIKTSRPKMNVGQRNHLKKAVSELRAEVEGSMFTYDAMHLGHADPHREYKLNKTPSIKVDPWLAKAANIKLDKDGKANRDEATKALKIGLRFQGVENTHTESFRKKELTCRTQKVEPYTGYVPELVEGMDGREAITEGASGSAE